jgi:hypothetical protein
MHLRYNEKSHYQLILVAKMLYYTCIIWYNLGMDKVLKAIRIDPEIFHLAKIQAVTQNKLLGDWLEEAIQEKIKRSEKDGNQNGGK